MLTTGEYVIGIWEKDTTLTSLEVFFAQNYPRLYASVKCKGPHAFLASIEEELTTKATTQINVQKLEKQLYNYNDRDFVRHLVDGFDNSFFTSPENPLECKNLRSALRHCF